VGGIDGWIDDCLALTPPWGFDLSGIRARASVWYGTADVLASRNHHEHLLASIPGAERCELREDALHQLDRELAFTCIWSGWHGYVELRRAKPMREWPDQARVVAEIVDGAMRG
jgi:hypothetical protein